MTARLMAAAEEMLKFGNHEGACDNDEACGECGSPTRGCMQHREALARRQAELQLALLEAKSER